MEETGELVDELRRREAELAEVHRIARVGSWAWEAADGSVTWSESLHRIAGVGPAFEPSWESFFEVVHPDDRARMERSFRHTLATDADYTVMHRFLTEAGGERLVLCRASVERNDDGSPRRVVGATMDLTDLQRSAELHRARHEQLGAAEELTGVGSFEWDIVNDRVTWSDNLYRIFGHRPGDFEGTFEGYLEAVHPEDQVERRQVLEALLESGDAVRSEHRIVRPSGQVRRLASHVRVVRDPAGRPLRMIGACQDITELG